MARASTNRNIWRSSELLGAAHAALAFQTNAIEDARRIGRMTALAEAWTHRAATQAMLGKTQEAARDAADAAAAAARVEDRWTAARLAADAAEVNGRLAVKSQPVDAVRHLSRAMDYFEQNGSVLRTASLFLTRGQAYEAAGADAEAEADYRRGIEIFEQRRKGLESEELRISYFEQAWDLFSYMIRAALKRGAVDVAFEFAERARARTLLDSWTTTRAEPAPSSIEIFRAKLPSSTLVVYFERWNDVLVAWAIRSTGYAVVQTQLPREFDAQLRRYREAIGGRRADTISDGLYDVLWRPLERHVQRSDRLVIVPSRDLQSVAFAGLRNPRSGRYLVEEHVVLVAPSMALFDRAAAKAGQYDAPAVRLLAVGDPARASGVDAALPRLRDAAAEANEIARLYPQRDVLAGANATKQRFLDGVKAADVVHFGVHSIVNAHYPFLSRLIFAGNGTDTDADLYASEIGELPLGHVRLVVMAACSSGVGPFVRGEGVLSLARPFMAAGVPAVVATLWDVEDRPSRLLMREFHAAYLRHGDAARALREAQLALLHSGDSSLGRYEAWGGFQLIGAAAANASEISRQGVVR